MKKHHSDRSEGIKCTKWPEKIKRTTQSMRIECTTHLIYSHSAWRSEESDLVLKKALDIQSECLDSFGGGDLPAGTKKNIVTTVVVGPRDKCMKWSEKIKRTTQSKRIKDMTHHHFFRKVQG